MVNVMKVFTLVCDANGCSEYADQNDTSAQGARTDGQKHGWTRKGRKDYCPAHSA